MHCKGDLNSIFGTCTVLHFQHQLMCPINRKWCSKVVCYIQYHEEVYSHWHEFTQIYTECISIKYKEIMNKMIILGPCFLDSQEWHILIFLFLTTGNICDSGNILQCTRHLLLPSCFLTKLFSQACQ